MKKYLAVGLLAIGLIGCSTVDDISIIKKSKLTFDRTISVGKALDNYGYCKSSEWREFKPEHANKIVEFDCLVDTSKEEYIKNVPFELRTIIRFAIHKDNTFNLAYCGFRATMPDGKVSNINANNDEMKEFIKAVYEQQLPLSLQALELLSEPLLKK